MKKLIPFNLFPALTKSRYHTPSRRRYSSQCEETLSLDIDPLTPAIGAEVTLYLDKTIVTLEEAMGSSYSEVVSECIHTALMQHHVVFFRDQHDFTAKSHVLLAESFGPIEESAHAVYPQFSSEYPSITVLETQKDGKTSTDEFHTDKTFQAQPPFMSILHAVEVPRCGGDTIWTSQVRAYDALPPAMKQEISDLKAVHDMGSFRNDFCDELDDVASGQRIRGAHQSFGSAVHPVVGRHPVLDKPYLNVNPGFTAHIVGKNQGESSRLLSYLFDHMIQPEFQVRWRWRSGMVALWDNRCTMHYAVSDYLGHYRRMQRITVACDRRSQDE